MPAARPPLALEDHLCFALYSASMAINRAYKPFLDEIGLTYPQYLVLLVLWGEKEGQTVGAIADRLSLNSSTITPLVKRLEIAGFATRRRNPDNEREVIVALTPAGRALRERTGCLAETLLVRSGLSVDELVGLNRSVSALRDAVAAGRDGEDRGAEPD